MIDHSIRSYMTDSYILVSEDQLMDETIQLPAGCFAIVMRVVKKGTHPISLLESSDIGELPLLPPVILVGVELNLYELVDALAMTLFDGGARGAVVMGEENQIAGILPLETIDRYIGSQAYALAPKTMDPLKGVGDVEEKGSYQTPLGYICCRQCGHLNKIDFLDPSHLPVCQSSWGIEHGLLFK